MKTTTRLSLMPVLLAGLLACDGTTDGPIDPTPTPPPSPPPTGEIAILGLGSVLDRYTSEVAVDGDFAYTSTWGTRGSNLGNAVKIWNVAGSTPLLLDSLIVPEAITTGDVQVSDDGALLVVATEFDPGRIMIYERSNPARPTLVSSFTSQDTDPGVHTVKLGRVNGRHYAFLSVDPFGVPAKLVIVDITNPAQPVQVSSLTIGSPYVHDVFVRDGWLFTALWNQGLRIYDIGGAGRGGSPENPVALGTVVTAGGQVHNAWWFHNPATGNKDYVFVGQETPQAVFTQSLGDIHVVDISDPDNPVEVAFYTVPSAGTHNFSMDEEDGVLYAAYYEGGVRAIDVRGDLGTCEAAQRAPDGRCNLALMGRELAVALETGGHYVWGVEFQDGFLYASDMLNGLYKLDARSVR